MERGKAGPLGLLLLFTSLFSGNSGASIFSANRRFDASFAAFLEKNDYSSATIGLMGDGKLLYAQGYGKTDAGHEVHPGTLFPISGISKSLTAVAVMKLVEEGQLNLTSKVFGKHGVLWYIKPWDESSVDPFIYNITVEDLLRYSAGWNSYKAPLFDPILNSVYLKKGFNVPNITSLMKLKGPPDSQDIIRYVISKPLNFAPGTKSVYSNLEYLMLGRVIEAVSTILYEDYVKNVVLIPCGMWRTRIGPNSKATRLENVSLRQAFKQRHLMSYGPLGRIYDYLDPKVVDSALGWYSNVYDLMRFMRCLDGTGEFQVVSLDSLKRLLKKPLVAPDQHLHSWRSGGFHVNNQGVVWQESDPQTEDVLLFHQNLLQRPTAATQSHPIPDSLVILLSGRKRIHLKHMVSSFFDYVKDWPPSTDYFWNDVGDLKLGTVDKDLKLVRFRLSEHHLSAYISALKMLQLKLEWISAFFHDKETFFTLVAKHDPGQLFDDYYLKHGMDEKKLLHNKHVFEPQKLYLCFMQCYVSSSHGNENRFLAVFQKQSGEPADIKFGTKQYSQSYKLFIQLYREKGYHPKIQSLIHMEDEALVSFLLEKKQVRNLKEYVDVRAKELSKDVRTNVLAGRQMIYLDASDRYGKPRFSAIFEEDKKKRGMFKIHMTKTEVEKTFVKMYEKGSFLPKLIVGYTNKKGELLYAVFVEKRVAAFVESNM